MTSVHHQVREFVSTARREYKFGELNEQSVDADPIIQFGNWIREAIDAQVDEPHAMTLATADHAGNVSARIVLLRGFDERGFAFYTNYESHKGRDLADNPRAALVFHWTTMERQVRVTGPVARISSAESDDYFRNRPRSHQLSAWVSQQSRSIADRHVLNQAMRAMEHRFLDQDVPRPEYWGGFILAPEVVELWQGRPNRLHDRLCYRRTAGSWILERLSP
ncbi:MAG: pyridoxamine 5'-phosphate oxidase [Candidatus Binataceae bacterium]